MHFSRPRRQVSKLEVFQNELRTEPVPPRFPTYVSIVDNNEQRDAATHSSSALSSD
jgi:hypothetical protein